MPTFAYTALELVSGEERAGILESANVETATAALKTKGFAPMSLVATLDASPRTVAPTVAKETELRAVSASQHSSRRTAKSASSAVRLFLKPRGVRKKAVLLFTRQLATLVRAGMPLLRGLQVLAKQEREAEFRNVLENLADTIRSGGTLSDGLARHPKLFDRLYVNMIKAGEAGGVLETVLERLAGFMEKSERIKGKIKSAMTYPVIVIVLAVTIVAALMVIVVPKFEQIFAGLLKGQPLPTLTRAVLAVSSFVQHHFLIAAALGVGGYATLIAVKKTQKGARGFDWLMIKSPVWGDLFLKASIARFTRTLGTLLSSGVPILQALLITRDTSGNLHVAHAVQRVHDRAKAGEGVSRPLAETGIFPALVTSMIEVGEETGALPDMLSRVADNFDEEVDNAVGALTSLIEPFMIVFLALLVGTIVIALFLPIVSIIQHLQ
jgi:type IV pilus assembly protein PilC